MLLKKYSLAIIIVLVLVLILLIGFSLFKNKNNPNVSTSTGIVDTVQNDKTCKQAGESICINPIICPDNKDKCCKGLYAIIETKSSAICRIPSSENISAPRVKNLEQ